MSTLPPPRDDLEVAEFETELVVLVPRTRMAYHLREDTALVFDSCRRRDTMEDLTDELVTAVGADPSDVEVWVRGVLEELTRQGLLAEV